MNEVRIKMIGTNNAEQEICIVNTQDQAMWHSYSVPVGVHSMAILIPKLTDQEKDELKRLRELEKKHEKFVSYITELFPDDFGPDYDIDTMDY